MSKRMILIVIASSGMLFGGCDCSATKSEPAMTEATPSGRVARKDWCAEHAVPEAICTRCNAKLIPEFKKKGDWCKEHNLPESQCLKCNPALKEKFEAMAPKP